MTETILVLNSGSSSIKFQLYSVSGRNRLERRIKGQIEGIGTRPRLIAKGIAGENLIDETWPAAQVRTIPAGLDKLVAFLREQIGGRLPVAIGHRVVHGGPAYTAPTIVTEKVLDQLRRFIPLAPLHQPNNLAPIQAILERLPNVPQVACFDTAFHRGHADVADRFAISEQLYAEGVRRYGFHGLSYEYIAGQLRESAPDIAHGRIVAAHLGSGASMCAISAGRSVESTMGFTALDGLPMGTRPGQLDPGIVLYLMSEKKLSAEEIEHFLYHDCGLKGLSGISNDVRELLASTSPRAKLALDYLVYRIVLFTGLLAAAMDGIDGFVFTAGVGENAPVIREAVARRLSWLGLELDAAANIKGGPMISCRGSRVACYVIATDEELMIARHTLHALRTGAELASRSDERD
jgi:acetate kinase